MDEKARRVAGGRSTYEAPRADTVIVPVPLHARPWRDLPEMKK